MVPNFNFEIRVHSSVVPSTWWTVDIIFLRISAGIALEQIMLLRNPDLYFPPKEVSPSPSLVLLFRHQELQGHIAHTKLPHPRTLQ